MATKPHIIVDEGNDKGKEITVPTAGARLGRSSKNDIVLVDPKLSRHHCRFYFKPDGTLCLTDLGSANSTLVNDAIIEETDLKPGDRVLVGDTVLRVLEQAPPLASVSTTSMPRISTDAPVNLGLGPDAMPDSSPRKAAPKFNRKMLLTVAALVILLAIGAWIPQLLKPPTSPSSGSGGTTGTPAPAPRQDTILEVSYEKVEADLNNIFRYKLDITENNTISVQIDDIANNRHVRKEKKLTPEYTALLVSDLKEMGFFALDDRYEGVQPNTHNAWDLSLRIGSEAHRSHVINRVAPDAFTAVAKRLEECGKVEFGLWAIQFSSEKLTEMAEEAYLLGRKLLEEREVKYGNLSVAIKSYAEAEWYLETVEPKPDFYPAILSGLEDSKQHLQKRYDDRLFSAERAIKLSDWETAARELRVICNMVPDRTDERNEKARRKLLEVENRLETMR